MTKEAALNPGTIECECGGHLRPATLDLYDFSDYVGFEVTLRGMDGLKCDKCGGETLPGGMINTVLNYLVVELSSQPRRLSGAEASYLRRNLGATQEELASRMGIVRETVAKWECGDTNISPQHDFILRLISLGFMAEDGLLPPEKVSQILGTSFRAVRSDPPRPLEPISFSEIAATRMAPKMAEPYARPLIRANVG